LFKVLEKSSTQVLKMDVAAYRVGGGKLIEFLYELGSPNSYLAYTQLKDRIDAETWYRPFLPGGLYEIVGTLS
jgi:2-hydroxychromene-2-carboxylate isomerase